MLPDSDLPFNHILRLIQDADGIEFFRIEESTEPDTAKGRWSTPYRHWKFIPTEFREKKA